MNDHQLLDVCEQLIAVIKDLFPEHAEFNSWIDHSRYACISRISWKLNNDENRPNKLSRIILVIIPCESIEDSDYKNRKQIVQERFKSFIQKKYVKFNPDHDVSRYKPPPTEEWLIDNDGCLNR